MRRITWGRKYENNIIYNIIGGEKRGRGEKEKERERKKKKKKKALF